MILLEVNLTYADEFQIVYEIFYETINTSIFA
jgi:hypothetical protein